MKSMLSDMQTESGQLAGREEQAAVAALWFANAATQTPHDPAGTPVFCDDDRKLVTFLANSTDGSKLAEYEPDHIVIWKNSARELVRLRTFVAAFARTRGA